MPLQGLRVVDLSLLAPGPYATRVLAELGAEVIKVEPPAGDLSRYMPPLVGDPPAGGVFHELNAGKKSVILDLKDDAGREAFRALVATADVLVDGFRPGVLARLGCDPEALMAAHPRLIYCAVTGFGLTGPDARRAGHDIGYLARAGVLELNGDAERPRTIGVQVADIGASLVAVSGICAALYERERTGHGRVVDVSLVESGRAFNALNLGFSKAGADVRRGDQLLDGSRPCYAVYATKDGGHLAVGALEPKFWFQFANAIGCPELANRGLDEGDLGAEVKAQVQAKLLERTRDEWTAVFRDVDCCVEPILSVEESEADAHLKARHAAGDHIRGPVRVSAWQDVGGPPPHTLTDAPAHGADTESVLRTLGLDDDLLQRLI